MYWTHVGRVVIIIIVVQSSIHSTLGLAQVLILKIDKIESILAKPFPPQNLLSKTFASPGRKLEQQHVITKHTSTLPRVHDASEGSSGYSIE